jgi:hypothetical protein
MKTKKNCRSFESLVEKQVEAKFQNNTSLLVFRSAEIFGLEPQIIAHR